MRITVGSILLLLSFSASTRVLAQPVEQKPPPERLTIAWAVDYALRTHPGIAQLEAKRASTDAERRLASVLGSPTLMYAREGIDSGVFSEERLTIAETLNSPLAARLAKRGVRLDVDAIDLDLVAERRAVARRVKIAYLDYVVATLLTSYREESVRLAEQLLQATERREAAGEAAVVDVLRAQVELSNVRLSLVDADRIVGKVEDEFRPQLDAIGARIQSGDTTQLSAFAEKAREAAANVNGVAHAMTAKLFGDAAYQRHRDLFAQALGWVRD